MRVFSLHAKTAAVTAGAVVHPASADTGAGTGTGAGAGSGADAGVGVDAGTCGLQFLLVLLCKKCLLVRWWASAHGQRLHVEYWHGWRLRTAGLAEHELLAASGSSST